MIQTENTYFAIAGVIADERSVEIKTLCFEKAQYAVRIMKHEEYSSGNILIKKTAPQSLETAQQICARPNSFRSTATCDLLLNV